jgi:hypothetical protein
MLEERPEIKEVNSELELVYAHMPQNDKQQIEQVVREYEGDRDNGLVHGVQKDAIQNAFGAREITDEVKACQKNWRCYFELVTIKGRDALVFWDEGTTGLTGDILSVDEIEKKSAEGLLGKEHANQRLARFLTRFESGGNIGPGTFGRGKLIFQGASKDYSILVDSLRSDDEKYIAFDRLIKGTQLKQQKIPFEGDKAKRFIHEATGGVLKPLTSHGTRITILNVKDEIIEAFKKSFTKEADEGGYSEVFSRMIEETWWEIIEFGAKIILRMKGKEKEVELTQPLKSILRAKDKEKGFRVYEKRNIPVVVDSAVYRIKHLKFVVAPNPIEEELREIWVQRKRMKVGSLSKGIFLHHKIQKNFTGYVILEPRLEELFEEKESPTHYGFTGSRGRGGGAIGQVRAILRSSVEEFHKQLGLRTQSPEAKARQDMLNTLKELNEHAEKLGLPTEFSVGTPKKDVEITIKEFTLPNPTSTRVEIGNKIGPIVYQITNNSNKPQFVRLEITAEQRNRPDKMLMKKDFDLKPNANEAVDLSFDVRAEDFVNGEGLLVRARIVNRNSNEQMHQVSRMLWIGMDPPVKPQDPLTITSYAPLFPRPQSRRVEKGESIKNVHFRVTSNVAIPLKVNLDMVVRKAKSPTQDVRDLSVLVTQRSFELPALSDREFAVEEIKITEDTFGSVFDEAADAKERKCEIFFSVRAAENYPSLGKNISDHLGPKKAIPFYCGIDPAGMSIFKNCLDSDSPDDGRRSWVVGDQASGYTFILNVGHSSIRLADDLGDEFRKYHIKEQMLFQAYLIAVEQKIFKGPAETFEDVFSDDNISPIDKTRYIDEIVGIALNQLS